MNKLTLSVAAACFMLNAQAQQQQLIPANPDVVVEPFTYTENFEDRELGAWASYPHWQDIAYNQDFRPNEMVPGDPNISVVQQVRAFTNVDAYAGAQKLLDMYLVPEAKINFRYYLKSNSSSEYYKLRFAAGELGKLDYTINNPERNKWVNVSVSFNDLVSENPKISGKDKIRIYAMAFIAKFPSADPDMPIYFGIDDISFSAARETAFKFNVPEVYKLPEYAQYIPKKHYSTGEDLVVTGQWPLEAKNVNIEVLSFADQTKSFYKGELIKSGSDWVLKPLKLTFPIGLYLAKLKAVDGNKELASTEFTIHIAPTNMAGKHPRLLFDADKKKLLAEKINNSEFRLVKENIVKSAKEQRTKIPVSSLIFDLDQFPKEDWLPTWSAWGSKIYHTAEALRANSEAYAFNNDREAGVYVKDVLVKLAGWPNWTHPWQTNRGRYSEHRTGSWAHRVAEAYDLTYELMTAQESKQIRKAIMDNIVGGAHRTYVLNDDITAATSNWLAMIMGGSLMNMAAIYGDGPETENLEPYFTGAMIKYNRFINKVVDRKDGAWGEGLGYNSYSFSNMAYSIPSLNNVFKIDLSKPLVGSYTEFIWAGNIKDKKWYEWGDSGGNINPATNWAFLLEMQKEPRLSWFYNYLKHGKVESNTKGSNLDVDKKNSENDGKGETIMDLYFNTKGIPQDSPFDENPVKAFREVGTTVFKSGWERDDFSFVMRSGAFYNHQHIDQGSFWLVDKGVTFIEERSLKNSTYYDDPIYQSKLIQPVAHSTILINDNEQSQRTGDHLNFAPGFNDHAYIASFLDGKDAAFSSGNLGRLYFDKVKDLSRNVLYIKPRTLLMLDTAIPSESDAKVTLLYQTAELEHINPGKDVSNISKEGQTLNIMHLSPKNVETQAVETPHYLYTLQRVRHLKKEGMLTVSANTKNKQPLVMANLLTTEGSDGVSDVVTEEGDGFVSGMASGKKFAFSTNPGKVYQTNERETDAAAMTWTTDRDFVAMATSFSDRNSAKTLISSEVLTFEWSVDGVKYSVAKNATLSISSARKPKSVLVNGKAIRNFKYDSAKKQVSLEIQAGEGLIKIN